MGKSRCRVRQSPITDVELVTFASFKLSGDCKLYVETNKRRRRSRAPGASRRRGMLTRGDWTTLSSSSRSTVTCRCLRQPKVGTGGTTAVLCITHLLYPCEDMTCGSAALLDHPLTPQLLQPLGNAPSLSAGRKYGRKCIYIEKANVLVGGQLHSLPPVTQHATCAHGPSHPLTH